MKDKIRVSVVMPCYNAEKYVGEAIESILKQSYPYFKLIVVDDGSHDRSRAIIEKYAQRDNRIQLLCNIENRGQVYTRNRALLECDTEYIALMDADDIAPFYRFEKEVIFLDNHPDIGAIGGEYQLINEDGKVIGKSNINAFDEKNIKANLFFRNVLANSSMMFRAGVMKKNNILYQDGDRGSSLEDYRFWSRFSNHTSIVNLPCVLLQYRIVGNSISHISRKNRITVRNQIFDEIHSEMFDKNGFVLGKNSSLFMQMFRDEFCCNSLEEWRIAFRCLKSINRQAAEMKKNYGRELKKVSIYNMLRLTKSLLGHTGRFCFSKKGKRE